MAMQTRDSVETYARLYIQEHRNRQSAPMLNGVSTYVGRRAQRLRESVRDLRRPWAIGLVAAFFVVPAMISALVGGPGSQPLATGFACALTAAVGTVNIGRARRMVQWRREQRARPEGAAEAEVPFSRRTRVALSNVAAEWAPRVSAATQDLGADVVATAVREYIGLPPEPSTRQSDDNALGRWAHWVAVAVTAFRAADGLGRWPEGTTDGLTAYQAARGLHGLPEPASLHLVQQRYSSPTTVAESTTRQRRSHKPAGGTTATAGKAGSSTVQGRPSGGETQSPKRVAR